MCKKKKQTFKTKVRRNNSIRRRRRRVHDRSVVFIIRTRLKITDKDTAVIPRARALSNFQFDG